MKKVLLISTAVLALTTAHKQTDAQSLNCLWAKSAGGIQTQGWDAGYGTAIDNSGNIYVTGEFSSPSITFGSITLTNTSSGYGDFYLVKYDANGNVLWAKSASGNGRDLGAGVSTDNNGNVYVTGNFNSTSITFGSTTLTKNGISNLFIVKYDSQGNILIAKSFGSWWETAHGIYVSGNGNIYITGNFESNSVTFGSYTINSANSNTQDVFVAKFDSQINALWAKGNGGNGDDFAHSVTADNNGNVYITGEFRSTTLSFGSTTLNASSTTNTDFFIAGYDNAGNSLWAKRAGNTSYSQFGNSITSDINGNIYVTGEFQGSTILLDTISLITDNGVTFVAKYNSSGNVLWAKVSGQAWQTSGGGMGYGICTDQNGNIYLTGEFLGTITFGTDTITSAGSMDIYFAKYDSFGNAIWAVRTGGNGTDEGLNCSADANGNVVATGIFSAPSITFGSTTLTNADNTGNTYDIFIVKFNGVVGIEENYFYNSINIFPNPFSTQTTLQTDNLLHNATLTVDNCFGQTVAQIKNLRGQTITFNRDNLASGLYFVRLTEENKTISVDKLVITE
ncbi:MAG: SBBP repeat-containing protein [Bacteroidetes bacterium]|nr:SBBP repeat-containing protein [Bacteroidota bacterium]